MIARQTGYYWGTGGHTPEPVVIGAIGPGSTDLRGYQDNTEVGNADSAAHRWREVIR
jgi:alkaline phosphatase